MEVMSSLGAIASLNTIAAVTGSPEQAGNWAWILAACSAIAALAAVAFLVAGSGEGCLVSEAGRGRL